jgi:hypothetical protein
MVPGRGGGGRELLEAGGRASGYRASAAPASSSFAAAAADLALPAALSAGLAETAVLRTQIQLLTTRLSELAVRGQERRGEEEGKEEAEEGEQVVRGEEAPRCEGREGRAVWY